MKVTRKTEQEIAILRTSGQILAEAMNLAIKRAQEAINSTVTTIELNQIAEKHIRKKGAKPAFLNYAGGGEPFPAALCVSLNDEIVHGVPKQSTKIKEGDLVSLDLGVEYKGMFTDAAVTLMIGKVSRQAQKLTEITKKSLEVGIAQLRDGARLGDYGAAVDKFATLNGFVTVKGLVGHGVGYAVHEPPQIPNYGEKNTGFRVKEGMVLALEPMLAVGDDRISLGDDEFSFVTYDGSLSAHFEHTVVITKKGCEILTAGIKL